MLPSVNCSLRVLFTKEACAEGNRYLCGTVCLDVAPEAVEKRIATKLYNDCRTGAMTINGFPQFDGLIRNLKDGISQREGRTYNVCVQQGDRLVVLQSVASKFTESELTKDQAVEMIKEHNKLYNCDGEYWLEDERPAMLVMLNIGIL